MAAGAWTFTNGGRTRLLVTGTEVEAPVAGGGYPYPYRRPGRPNDQDDAIVLHLL